MSKWADTIYCVNNKYTCRCNDWTYRTRIVFYTTDEHGNTCALEFVLCSSCNGITYAPKMFYNGYSSYKITDLLTAIPEKVVDAVDGCEHIVMCEIAHEEDFGSVKEVTPIVTICNEKIWLVSKNEPVSECQECKRIMAKIAPEVYKTNIYRSR